jgi:hypothetical protein
VTQPPDASLNDHLDRFSDVFDSELAEAPTLEAAAQLFCERFYATFADFTVLVRIFGTFSYGQLPGADKDFAGTYLARSGAAPQLEAGTPVLTLLGTRGIEEAWCSRTASRDHRAIPLLSDEFVDEIPMIARLLGEIGFPRLANRAAWQFVTRDTVDVNGLFFVGDAHTTTDERGRHIIPSTNFVERYGVKTVFGFGGPYTAAPTFVTAIVFARRALARAQTSRFAPLIGDFKAATRSQVDRGAIFSGSEA